MAKQANLKFSGTVGNIIFYERWGGYYMRTKPACVKQTAATKASAGKFGNAVRISKALRSGLQPLFTDKLSRNTILKFNNAVYKSLLENENAAEDLPCISGFEFNELSTLKERMRLTAMVNRNNATGMEIQLPAFVPAQKIKAPPYTKSIHLKMAAAICSMQAQTLRSCCNTEIMIPYANNPLPPQSIALTLQASKDDMIVLAFALEYEAMRKGILQRVSDMRWQPVGIVQAAIANS